jgi:hypothetical protein
MIRAKENERGFLSARIRTFMRVRERAGAGCGIVFMMSQNDITGNTGDFYGLFVGETLTNGVPELALFKFRDGLLSAPQTVLYSEGYDTGERVFALEVEWESDLGALNGTRIIVRRSDPSMSTVNFSDMTTVYNEIDTTSPLVITEAEGIAYHNVFGGTCSFLLDNSTMILGA